MEDIAEKISRLLSSPDGMEKIRAAMAAMGAAPPDGGGTAEEPPLPPLPTPAPATPTAPAPATGGGILGGDAALLGKLLPLLGDLRQENDDTRLLQALRPYLHGEREQRLDETIRLMRFARLLPLLREQDTGDRGGDTHG